MLEVWREGTAVGDLGRCLAVCLVLRRGGGSRMDVVARRHFDSGEEAVKWGRERDDVHVRQANVLFAGTLYVPDRSQGWTDAELIKEVTRRSYRMLGGVLGKKGF